MRPDGSDRPRPKSALEILLEREKERRIRQQEYDRLHPFSPKPNPNVPVTPTPMQIIRQMNGLAIHPSEQPRPRHRPKERRHDPVPDATEGSRRKQKRQHTGN